jgi:hypothetical protein
MASAIVCTVALPAGADFIRGGATLSTVSSVVKISRAGHGLETLTEGEVLYIFTEKGEPVAQVVIKGVFADEIHSEPLPSAVARAIRESNAILVFSNLREYGDFIKAYLLGSADAFEDFIARFPKSELRHEAQRVIDGLIYRPYKIRGSVEAFEEFMRNYPENSYFRSARERRDRLLFERASRVGRINALSVFMGSYPDNLYLKEAESMVTAIQGGYRELPMADLANSPRNWQGKQVRFTANLHSSLPIYVEGFSVGRKTAGFTSPRNSAEHLNIQVQNGPYVLWRLFIDRELVDLTSLVEETEKGTRMKIYGTVFEINGGAPWIQVEDLELFEKSGGS